MPVCRSWETRSGRAVEGGAEEQTSGGRREEGGEGRKTKGEEGEVAMERGLEREDWRGDTIKGRGGGERRRERLGGLDCHPGREERETGGKLS